MVDPLVLVFLLLIAMIVGFLCWWFEDCRRWDKVRKMAEDENYWCEQACLYCKQCNENHKDPDDVWNELQDYCSRCPLVANIEMWEEQRK